MSILLFFLLAAAVPPPAAVYHRLTGDSVNPHGPTVKLHHVPKSASDVPLPV